MLFPNFFMSVSQLSQMSFHLSDLLGSFLIGQNSSQIKYTAPLR